MALGICQSSIESEKRPKAGLESLQELKDLMSKDYALHREHLNPWPL